MKSISNAGGPTSAGRDAYEVRSRHDSMHDYHMGFFWTEAQAREAYPYIDDKMKSTHYLKKVKVIHFDGKWWLLEIDTKLTT